MGIIPRFGVFGDVENGRECPVYRGFWGVGGGFGVCARGFECGGWALLGLSEPLGRRLGGVRGVRGVRGVWGV